MIPFLWTQRKTFNASRLLEIAVTKMTCVSMEKMKHFKYDIIGS